MNAIFLSFKARIYLLFVFSIAIFSPFNLFAIALTNCGQPLSSGSVSTPNIYTLQNDLPSGGGVFSGDCLTATNLSNVIIDGGGHTILATGKAINFVAGSNTGNIEIRNLVADGTISITGTPGSQCPNPKPTNFNLHNIHMRFGEIAASCLAGFTAQDNESDLDGISATRMSNSQILRNDFRGGMWGASNSGLTISSNLFGAEVSFAGDYGANYDYQILNNEVKSATGNLDTLDVFRMRQFRVNTLPKNIVSGNYIESFSVLRPTAVVVKWYENHNVNFSGNTLVASGRAPAYGALELRSSNMDDDFVGNRIYSNGVGIFTHFSNLICDANGYFSPEGAAPYNHNCYMRRLKFDSNYIFSSGLGFNSGDGSYDYTLTNNLITGGAVITGCGEESTAKPSSLFNNTISGQFSFGVTGSPVWNNSACHHTATNNIFSNAGGVALNPYRDSSNQTATFTALTNITDNSGAARSALFVNPDPSDWTTRNFHLRSSASAAINTGTTLGSVLKDIDMINRPQGAGYDIGAFESLGASADSIAPLAPTSLRAQAVSSSQVSLSWNGAADNVAVSAYDLYRSTNFDLSVPVLIAQGLSTKSFTDSGLSANTKYRYYVIARDAAGNSSPRSNQASAITEVSAPSTPANFSLSNLPLSNSVYPVRLSWGISSDDTRVLAYEVFGWDERMGIWERWLRVSGTASSPSVVDTDFLRTKDLGNILTYKVRAVDAAGNASQFSPFLTTVVGGAPDFPDQGASDNCTATVTSASQITLNWQKMYDTMHSSGYLPDPATYWVFRSQTLNGPYAKVATVNGATTTSYVDSGLAANTKYFYQVFPVESDGHEIVRLTKDTNSYPMAAVASATTQSGSGDVLAPSAPNNLNVH